MPGDSRLPTGWERDRESPPYATYRTESQSLKVEVEPDWPSRRHKKLGERPEAYTVALKPGRASLGNRTAGAREIEREETFEDALRRAYQFMQEHARRTDEDGGESGESDRAADPPSASADEDASAGEETAASADQDASAGEESGDVFDATDAAAGANDGAIFDEERAVEGVAAVEERAAVETLLSLRGYSDELFVDEVESLVGDGLRAVCHVDGREMTTAYSRDDVDPEYGQLWSAVRSLSKSHMERVAGDVGEAGHLLLGYEDVQYLLLVAPDERGSLIAVDADVELPIPGVATTLRPLVTSRLDGA